MTLTLKFSNLLKKTRMNPKLHTTIFFINSSHQNFITNCLSVTKTALCVLCRSHKCYITTMKRTICWVTKKLYFITFASTRVSKNKIHLISFPSLTMLRKSIRRASKCSRRRRNNLGIVYGSSNLDKILTEGRAFLSAIQSRRSKDTLKKTRPIPSLFKNILRKISLSSAGNLTLEHIYWWCQSEELKNSIGTQKVIYGLALRFMIYRTLMTRLSTSPMMLFKWTETTMGNLKRETKWHTNNFSAI